MVSSEVQLGLDKVGFDFVRRPEPLAAQFRPARRIPLLLLMVDKGRATGTTWKALQVLSWLISNPEHFAVFEAHSRGEDWPERPLVRIEPALDRAIDLAVGLGFLAVIGDRRAFKLTTTGRSLLDAVIESGGFAAERATLARIRGKLSVAAVERLLEWRTK